jgi:hypothetical protein
MVFVDGILAFVDGILGLDDGNVSDLFCVQNDIPYQ